jgi:hypothetical protein
MPLDAFKTAMSDIRIIDTARDTAAAACMTSLGFSQWSADSYGTSSPTNYAEADFYEYIDPAQAAEAGYPSRTNAAEEADTSMPSKIMHQPTKDEIAALEGRVAKTVTGRTVPSGGCLGEATRKLNGNAASRLPADPRGLAVDARIAANQDSRVKRAVSTWRECMLRHNLTYDMPILARMDQRWVSRKTGEPATPEEKEVAKLDATCQKAAQIVAIYKTIRAAHEQRLLDANKEKLIAAQGVFKAWVKNAQGILHPGG